MGFKRHWAPSSGRQSVAPAVGGGVLGCALAAVLVRMEKEYADEDSLSRDTVAAMYAVYGAHAAAFAWASGKRIWPVRLPPRASQASGGILSAAGFAIALAGARPFGPAQLSGIEPGSLHTTGIYRYSRNPQYLGLGAAVTGLALAARSAFGGLLAAGVWAAYRRWIPSEERHLARVFGGEYVGYQATVRRWLGTRSGAN